MDQTSVFINYNYSCNIWEYSKLETFHGNRRLTINIYGPFNFYRNKIMQKEFILKRIWPNKMFTFDKLLHICKYSHENVQIWNISNFPEVCGTFNAPPPASQQDCVDPMWVKSGTSSGLRFGTGKGHRSLLVSIWWTPNEAKHLEPIRECSERFIQVFWAHLKLR